MKATIKRLAPIAAAAALILTVSMGAVRAAPTVQPISIVAFGDSLTAGYQLPASQSFPVQLQMALEARGHKVQVVNAGVSGDTTAAGLERLEWTLQSGADAVILELGANDALRGVDPNVTRANLDKMLTIIAAKGADVLIAGMKAPGNWGNAYQNDFDAIFPDIAKAHNAALYPFFLDGVALNTALVMPDGLHPTGKGVAEIVTRILPSVETLIKKVAARKAAAN
ncbi:MAG: arylesterase [Hyphomicrobium sp.]